MFKNNNLLRLLKIVFLNPKLTLNLALRDIKTTYVKSYLGLIWVILEPLIMMALLTFVFGTGVKGGGRPLHDFLPYVFAGLIPYYFYSDALKSGAKIFSKYSFLVKKTTFKLEVLPMASILSNLFIHVIFLFLLGAILLILGVQPSIHWLQLIFIYMPLMVFQLYVLGLLLGSIEPFFRDIGKIIAICVRLLFWFTPIFWYKERIPEKYAIFLKLNPMYFFVEGYRNSLIYEKYIWQGGEELLIYCGITCFLLIVSNYVFSRLRIQFAEVI